MIDVGGDANAAGHGIIFSLTVCTCVKEEIMSVCICARSGPCVCVLLAQQEEKSPARKSLRVETSHAKNVNITENEVEVRALMESFGNCHCVKSNLLE